MISFSIIYFSRSHYKSVQKDAIKEKAFVKYFLLSTDALRDEEEPQSNQENIVRHINYSLYNNYKLL